MAKPYAYKVRVRALSVLIKELLSNGPLLQR